MDDPGLNDRAPGACYPRSMQAPLQKDRLLVAVSRDGRLQVRAARTTGVVADALTRHLPGELAGRALARAVTCACLLPVSSKDTERVSLQWSGAGPLRTVMAEYRPPRETGPGLQDAGALRVLCSRPVVTSGPGNPEGRGLGPALGRGFLSVLRQKPDGTFIRGQVELQSGEMDEDLEGYFRTSEQTPTRVRVVARLVREGLQVAAVGVLVQCLPGGSEDILPGADLHERLDPDAPPARLVEAALGGGGFDVLQETPLIYRCPCSRERVETGLMLLPPEELLEMINDDQGARVSCEFCGTTYSFDRAGLEDLLARKLTENGGGPG